MMHKFRDMPADVNLRKNIYVLIDEAHRTTGGDLGTYLMAAVPNATLIGFTGTPVDKTVHGKGTFKTFGLEDESGYLHKYSIAEWKSLMTAYLGDYEKIEEKLKNTTG
jgi:type I restriction enzyme R subunit